MYDYLYTPFNRRNWNQGDINFNSISSMKVGGKQENTFCTQVLKMISYDLICNESYLNFMFYVITRIGENKLDILWTEVNC